MRNVFARMLQAALLLAVGSGAWCQLRAQSLSADQLNKIAFEQKLGAQVSGGLVFRDEAGREVKLAEFFGRKPVVLVLGYYECPMLCTLALNGLIECLADLKWNVGEQFEVVNVSIDPRETPKQAAAKKSVYLRRYGRPGAEAGWHFLTGGAAAIETLTEEVGFAYAYDTVAKQFAHPAGLVVLTPQGRVAKYLFGVQFTPNDLLGALKDASGNRIGSRLERLAVLCFSYSPIQGKYGVAIMLGVRVMGVATLAGLVWMLVALRRREKTSATV